MHRLTFTVTALILLTAGCATEPAADTSSTVIPEVASTSESPVTTATATTRPTTTSIVTSDTIGGRRTLELEGGSRVYELFIPPGHDIHQPAPLVVVAHGGRGSASMVIARSGFDALAAEEGIIVVYPQGVDGVWDFDDEAEMDREEVNDVEFISALIDQVADAVAIDDERVYVVGFSQGFGLAALLACHMSDRIVAVVSVAGLHHHDGAACPEPQSARVLAIAGETDPITTEGAPNLPFADPPGPLVEELEGWVTTNECDPAPEEVALSADVTHHRYTCANGAALEVYLHPGGHGWPSEMSPGIETNQVIWEFLSRFVGTNP